MQAYGDIADHPSRVKGGAIDREIIQGGLSVGDK